MTISVSSSDELIRLDTFLSSRLIQFSRSKIQKLISEGRITVNDKTVKKNLKLSYGDIIKVDTSKFESLELPELKKWDYPLEVIYEDDDLAIINKPFGVISHPTSNNKDQTLVNILLNQFEDKLSSHPDPLRPGIVHRLDKDTSGLVVIARKNGFRNHIAEQFQNREVEKKYLAVIKGEIIGALTIDKPIARDRQNRTKMKVDESGREAISEAISLENFGGYSVVEVKIETGRTHQIRVHLSSNKTPIIGDKAYGSGSQLIKNLSDNLKDKVLSFPRQALHAYQLAFLDASNEMQTYKSNPPDDILGLIESLKSNENA